MKVAKKVTRSTREVRPMADALEDIRPQVASNEGAQVVTAAPGLHEKMKECYELFALNVQAIDEVTQEAQALINPQQMLVVLDEGLGYVSEVQRLQLEMLELNQKLDEDFLAQLTPAFEAAIFKCERITDALSCLSVIVPKKA